MIELKETKSPKEFHIYIDGKFCENAYLSHSEYFSDSFQSSCHLSKQSIHDFIPFTYIRLKNLFDWMDFENVVGISKSYDDDENISKALHIEILFFPDLLNWRNDFTFSEYYELFKKNYVQKGVYEELNFENDGEVNFWLSFKTDFFVSTIKEFILPYELKLKDIHVETLRQIAEKSSKNILNFVFDFPESLKTSCEQYLLYFARFLKDLGINATSNLKEEAGEVLFLVTPTDDIEALDKIREALAVYLNLPSSPIVYDESFAAMRLKQQVDNLQHAQRMTEMEFRLARKVIENQDKIIQQKDSVIEQQSKILEKITDKAVMINSAENKEELEEIFDGVRVGKSKFLAEQIGLHLNPATALKAVGKKLIGKDDDFTSLNLDKEDGE